MVKKRPRKKGLRYSVDLRLEVAPTLGSPPAKTHIKAHVETALAQATLRDVRGRGGLLAGKVVRARVRKVDIG
jgi:hypothetical protein